MANVSSSTDRPFILSCTVDFPDDIGNGPFNHALLDKMMLDCVSMGVSRIYWLYYGDAEPESYWGGGLYYHRLIDHGRRTLDTIGEPLKAVVPIAHKHGLEIYGVLKPYNTGASGSYPEGSPEPMPNDIPRIGGSVLQVIPFLDRYPHTRLRRHSPDTPPGLGNVPITKVRLLKKDDSPTRVRKENLEVWTSPNNYRYERKDVSFDLAEAVEPAPREVRDYYGELVTAKGAPVRTLTLTGLSLTDRFILVTTNFTEGDGDFENTGMGMVEAYGDATDPLPIVVANRSSVWLRPRDFRTYGLEFDSGFGTLMATLDEDTTVPKNDTGWSSLQSGGLIAFSRGKNEYLPGMACEVYPEVRKLWDGWIDRMLETGVDGIDLRISSHGNIVDEPWEYGFNEPVLDEYRRRYGEEPRGDGSDIDRISKIRGDHYTDFVRETSEKVRRAGKKMQFHMHTEAFRPDPVHGQIMGFPPNLRFDWRSWLNQEWIDAITLRTSWFEAWEDRPDGPPNRSRLKTAMDDAVVKEALNLTRELDIPAYLNRYLSRAVGLDEYLSDMEAAFHDPRLDGFDLYEYSVLAHATPDGSRLEPVDDSMERIAAKAKDLGLL